MFYCKVLQQGAILLSISSVFQNLTLCTAVFFVLLLNLSDFCFSTLLSMEDLLLYFLFSLLSHYINYLLWGYFPGLDFFSKHTYIYMQQGLSHKPHHHQMTLSIDLTVSSTQQSNSKKVGRPFFHHNSLVTLLL